jgi:hypothetical protein
MGVALRSLPADVMAIVVLTRVRMVRSGPSSRALWLAMVFLAGALSLVVAPVYREVNTLLGDPIGGDIAKLWCGLGAAVSVRRLAASLDRPDRASAWDWYLAAAAATLIAVPILIAPPQHLSPLLAPTTNFYDSTWRSWTLWLPFLAYLTWALVTAVAICWRHGRQSPPKTALRTGLTLIGAGCGLGLIYVTVKLVVVTAWHLHARSPLLLTFDNVAQTTTVAASATLVAVGSSWEAISGRVNRLRDRAWAAWSFYSLGPLWRAVVAIHPEIALSTGEPPWRRPRLRLLRRVVEIRDGVLALGGETDETIVTVARRAAELARNPDIDAAVVATAIHHRRTLDRQSERHGRLPIGASGNLREEVKWLKTVKREYRRQRSTSNRQTKLITETA